MGIGLLLCAQYSFASDGTLPVSENVAKNAINQQSTVVKGTVLDKNGEPIIGASVFEKGSNANGTITDFDGNFSLEIKPDASIVVSSIGFATQEIEVAGRESLKIILEEDSETLDEVVVVAYGTARKGDVTGALTNIKPTDSDAALNSVNSLLEGKVAGLVVNSASSMLGTASSVVIRGANSLRGDNQPLYVIDNVPQASTGEFASSGVGGTDFQIQEDPLSQLDPSDILDITVLKDASSTAIYGSRGANGVILITTKKGQEGSARVTASANFTVAEPVNLMNMLDVRQFAEYHNSRRAADSQLYHIVGDEVRYSFENANDPYDPANPSTYHVLTTRNWQKEIYNPSFSHSYSLSVSGGTQNTSYYISANFKDMQGTVENTALTQSNLRANLTAQLSPKVKLELLLNGSIRRNNMMAGGNEKGGPTGAISRTALDYVPYEMPAGDPQANADEQKTTVFSWINDYVDRTDNRTFNASLNLSYNISDNFTYNLRTGGNLVSQKRARWFGMQLYQGMNNNGLLAVSDLDRNNFSVENLLVYKGKIGKVAKIDATAGITYDDYNYLNTNSRGTQFSFLALREKGMSKAGNIEYMQPEQRDYQLLSYLARLNVSLYDRYLFTASFRADGSSKFTKKNRWGYFPSASVAWRMEQEEFLKNVRWLNQMKLRVSYGVTGNQSIDPYSTFSLYGQNSGGDIVYGGPDGTTDQTMIVTSMANTTLRWEQTASWNAGIDFGFFKSRLSGTIDFYQKHTTDLLIQSDLPGSAAFDKVYYNRGSLKNRGIEFSLNAYILDNDVWKWNVSGNIGVNRGRIADLGLAPSQFGGLGERVGYYGNSIADQFGAGNIFLEGEVPGLFFGYRTQGIVQTGDISENGVKYVKDDGTTGYYTSFLGKAPVAGDIKFYDANGDGTVDVNDRTIIGDPNPDFTYGFSTKISYRRLSLSASFNGVSGIDRFNTNTYYNGLPNSSYMRNIHQDAFEGMWTESNPSDVYPSSKFTLGNYTMDRYIEDASYLRCSDITLSYSLSQNWMKKIHFRSMMFSFSVKNAFIITDYSGYDPEVNSFAFDGLRPGIDMSSYPNSRSFILGVNLSF